MAPSQPPPAVALHQELTPYHGRSLNVQVSSDFHLDLSFGGGLSPLEQALAPLETNLTGLNFRVPVASDVLEAESKTRWMSHFVASPRNRSCPMSVASIGALLSPEKRKFLVGEERGIVFALNALPNSWQHDTIRKELSAHDQYLPTYGLELEFGAPNKAFCCYTFDNYIIAAEITAAVVGFRSRETCSVVFTGRFDPPPHNQWAIGIEWQDLRGRKWSMRSDGLDGDNPSWEHCKKDQTIVGNTKPSK